MLSIIPGYYSQEVQESPHLVQQDGKEEEELPDTHFGGMRLILRIRLFQVSVLDISIKKSSGITQSLLFEQDWRVYPPGSMPGFGIHFALHL